MGLNKVQRRIQLEEAIARYKKFMKENDFRDVKEYFEIGLEANVFIKDEKTLKPSDDLMFGFFVDQYGNILLDSRDRHKAVWQYTFRRQPAMQMPTVWEQRRKEEQQILSILRKGGL